MEKVQKLPSHHGVANPMGRSRRDRPKGREDPLEEESQRRKREERERIGTPERAEPDGEPREEAPAGEDRGRMLDEKA